MAGDVKGWGQRRWWQGGDMSDVGGGNMETWPMRVASDMATQVTWVANNMEDDVGGQRRGDMGDVGGGCRWTAM